MKLNRTIRNKDHMDNLLKYLDRMEIPERGLDVTVKDYEATRTLEQNRFMWRALYQPCAEQIGEATGRMLKRDDMHKFFKDQFGPREERTNPATGAKEYEPKSTTKYTKKEMSDYLEKSFAWGAEHGVWFA